MSACVFSSFAGFVSDCADIVCAEALNANRFLHALTLQNSSSIFFSSALLGNTETCGSVNLASWLSSPLSSTFAARTTTYNGAAVEMDMSAATVGTATASTTAATQDSQPTYVWRPITLGVLCSVLLLFLVVNTILLVFVKRKRVAMRAQCAENDHSPA